MWPRSINLQKTHHGDANNTSVIRLVLALTSAAGVSELLTLPPSSRGRQGVKARFPKWSWW